MTNDLRNIDRKCIYCNAKIDKECEDSCYLNIFQKSVLNSPAFMPSQNISNTVGRLFADEMIGYMALITSALEEVGFMGRMQALSRDYEELHTFATTLHDVGELKSGQEVLEFYKDPKAYENISRVWIELGKPTTDKAEGMSPFKRFLESNNGK
tara:strand:- start:453 stop:914 length:462 start_codon:yes stop_codon:yes gene_type:complete